MFSQQFQNFYQQNKKIAAHVHSKPLNKTNKNIGGTGSPGLWQAQKCGRVKPVNGIQTPSHSLIIVINVFCLEKTGD